MAHRIDTPSAQKDKFGAGKNGFTRGNPQTGEQATALDDDYFDMLQEEIVGVVEAAGIALEKAKRDQLFTALKKLFLSRANPFGDIKTDGAAAIAKALSNLGLDAGAPAIGIPFFWPSASMPNTVMTEWSGMVFLKFNGATFSASTYPKLALAFPGLVLPEARGEFPRIWDDGRGVDSGRTLLSAQGDASRNITGSISPNATGLDNGTWLGVSNGAGALKPATLSGNVGVVTNSSGIGASGISLDISRVVPTATEFRPRNIAFNLLVRAK
ncbi:hypothetical protein [Citrobacter portucalensis]|uniref:hypothetical protein n=1 Tax=Citrobacter portucalensis TaxID=1639133 RepID=UPI00226B3ACF|nr:hypothetical protein [Citrobacter portucalensis]MCX9071855.1 hypothetical protein [Citrobacter portucalensis]